MNFHSINVSVIMLVLGQIVSILRPFSGAAGFTNLVRRVLNYEVSIVNGMLTGSFAARIVLGH